MVPSTSTPLQYLFAHHKRYACGDQIPQLSESCQKNSEADRTSCSPNSSLSTKWAAPRLEGRFIGWACNAELTQGSTSIPFQHLRTCILKENYYLANYRHLFCELQKACNTPYFILWHHAKHNRIDLTEKEEVEQIEQKKYEIRRAQRSLYKIILKIYNCNRKSGTHTKTLIT